jgi:tetratricopeptide (TPR) repeat protein
LFEEHNPAKALPELRLAVANSKNPRVKYLLDLANCYQAQEPRQLDSAEKYFLKVLDADSVHIQAHYQLAKNSYLKGDTTAAKNINRRFLKLHPDNPLPYRNQGDFYLIEGDTLKAKEWYKKEKYYQDRLVTQPKQTDEE